MFVYTIQPVIVYTKHSTGCSTGCSTVEWIQHVWFMQPNIQPFTCSRLFNRFDSRLYRV